MKLVTDGELVEESDLGSIRRVTYCVAGTSLVSVIDSPEIHFAIFDDLPMFPFTKVAKAMGRWSS